MAASLRAWCRVLPLLAMLVARPMLAQDTGLTASGQANPGGAAARAPLARLISLSLHQVRLGEALDAISLAGQVPLMYSDRVVQVDRRVSLTLPYGTVQSALDQVLDGTNVIAEPQGERIVLVRRRGPLLLASGTIYGMVRDSSSGLPIDGVELSIDSLPHRTVTAVTGFFELTGVRAGIHRVTARRIGYHPAVQLVEVTDSLAVQVLFILTATPTQLGDLVITATGPKRRYELGNAIATIDVDSVMRTAPITSLTDLLESRVPGLVVSRTSGAPGDPSRLLLRGASSLTRSNDPIIIIDGIRAYSDQTDARSQNLAGSSAFPGSPVMINQGPGGFAAPSPLDQIDPNSIATIEVFKGPSAATLYGADAANGVIVITTKKGQVGPPRWTISTNFGTSTMPGRYPNAYFRWGHAPNWPGIDMRCPLADFGCVTDSLVVTQALNDPNLTPLGRGYRRDANVGVSGGSEALTYALNVSYANETGLLKLPREAEDQFESDRGFGAPDWMRRPHQLGSWGGTGQLNIRLGGTADLGVTTSINRSNQQRSSLDQQFSELMGVYADTVNNLYYPGYGSGQDGHTGWAMPRGVLVPDFFRKATAQTTTFREAASVNWRPSSWLSTNATAGFEYVGRRDQMLLPRGYGDPSNPNEGLGAFNTGNGTSIVTTVNASASGTHRLSSRIRAQLTVGGNYTDQKIADILANGTELAPGTSSINGAKVVVTSENRSQVTTFGWFTEGSLAIKERLFLSSGLRLDGGNTYGIRNTLAGFPKVSASYLISDEPFFPMTEVFNTLRLRAAYGQAGRLPGPTDKLRLYRQSATWFEGDQIEATTLYALGNTLLRPEKSSDIEAGFDADLFDNRIFLEVTGYRKTNSDALVPIVLPPSVGVTGDNRVLRNIGTVRNTGLEVSLGMNLLRSAPFSLTTRVNFSRNRNKLVRIGEGVSGLMTGQDQPIREGYPLFSRWGRPIEQFADVNGDRIIERSEVQLGDSMVFLGSPEPDYESSLFTTVQLFKGLFTIDAGFAYSHRFSQINYAAQQNAFVARGLNDPASPLSQQAALIVMNETGYGLAQTVSTFRFNSLSVAFNAPPSIASKLGARSAILTVQGSNLGLSTNYDGRDPNVNGYSSGNGVVADFGQMPIPREWSIGLRLGY